MAKTLKEYSFHIGIGTLIIAASVLFGFARTAGSAEADYKTLKSTVETHTIELKRLPIVETKVGLIQQDVSEIKNDIKTLLRRK